jgi:cytosine/adenosine deaminase-related metal-dependent hydrolase
MLVVHGVQLRRDELRRLAEQGGTLVTCPRSNRWVGAGDPDVAAFYDSGVRLAVGTDSLASVQDLNIFSELAQLRALAPEVPAHRLLYSATQAGADALGFGAAFGSIRAGKRATLIAVEIPAGVIDVEEYLVNGVSPAAVRWLPPGREES